MSAYDSPAGAIRCAVDNRGKLGLLIVHYDIPNGSRITREPVPRDPGHWDLYGDKEDLKWADYRLTA